MRSLLLLPLLLLPRASVEAQGRAIAPAPSRLFAVERGTPRVAASIDTVPKQAGDYRWTGAVIGGVLGGTIGYVIQQNPGGDPVAEAGGSTDDGKLSPLVTVGGLVLGASVGYLLGSTVSKGVLPDLPPPAPMPEDTGLNWWQGGLLGLGIGGLAGAGIGKFYDSYHNCGCDDPGMGVYTGAVLGGLVGMLVGAGQAQDH